MKKSLKTLGFAVLISMISLNLNAQSLKVPAPSPTQTLKQAFALSEISIEYSRPSAKGRAIFGNLVPFDQIWRTGANASTKVTFGEDVKINGDKSLTAGTYALYTKPGKTSWTIMFYKDLKLGGNVADYKTENEVISFTVPAKHIADTIETFTINIDNMSSNKANIVLSWENTKVVFSVEANIDASIMKSIDNVMNNDGRPYYQAASYYYENGKDLALALTWVNKAVEQNPKAYWVMMLKAKIEHKMNDTAASIASANKVKALAKEGNNNDYVKMA
ncbi:MAG: DUF2911 domain-containing protein, partial [Bacteroidia bacterium]|nr:DUF2911 domain-containing protein [Bacteroidia bacterium]